MLATAWAAEAPSWYNDYVKVNSGCEQEFLCVVGDGESLADALSQARSEAAKFFQTKVKSKSQISSSSEQLGMNPSLGRFDEWTNKTINEETSELVSGLEIKKSEEVSRHFYVLMSLDRSKTAKLLKVKIEDLDNENNKMFALNSRFAIPKILNNLILIEAFNDRYSLLSNLPIKLQVKKEAIIEKINHMKALKMAFMTKGKKLPIKLNHLISELLSPLKIVLVSSKQLPKYYLHSEVLTEEQYFNVDGFKKLNVIFRLELTEGKNKSLGKVSALSEQVARTPEQAIENASSDIKLTLQDNLEQLSNSKMED